MGHALHDQGKLDESIAELRKAITLDPKSAVFHLNLGSTLRDQGKLDEAVIEYRKAIELDPKSAVSHLNLGSTLRDQGKLDEAIAEFRNAIELDPKLATARDNLGIVLREQRKFTEAIACHKKAIELDPNFVGAHNNLAWLLANCTDATIRDPVQAVDLARKTVQLAPNKGAHWNTLGVAQYRKGDWKAAIEALTKSMELRNGGDGNDWFFLAMAHWQLGDKPQAHSWYDKAVSWMEKTQPKDDELVRFRRGSGLAGCEREERLTSQTPRATSEYPSKSLSPRCNSVSRLTPNQSAEMRQVTHFPQRGRHGRAIGPRTAADVVHRPRGQGRTNYEALCHSSDSRHRHAGRSSGEFPESPGNDRPTKECNDDDSETVRDRGAGPVPGFPGAGEGAVQLYHLRRARIDPDRGQRE